MKTKTNLFNLFISFLLVIFLIGCGGLPKDVKQRAKAIPDNIKAAREKIDTNKKAYETLTKESVFSEFLAYAQKENWIQKFDASNKELDRANTLYSSQLLPLIKQNKQELSGQVTKETSRIKSVIKNAREISKYPYKRFNLLKKTIKDADLIHKKAMSRVGMINNTVQKLETKYARKALEEFPDIKDKINAKYAPFLKIKRDILDQQKIVQEQYSSHKSGSNTDYALFADNADFIYQNLVLSQQLDKKFRKDINQLYKSYTKILKDMKSEYFLTVARESWNNQSDYNTSKIAKFTRQVSPEVFEFFTQSTVETIAEIKSGMFGSKFSSPMENEFKQLKINPTDNWPSGGHDAAVFWVDNSQEKYFHKYIMVENDEKKETGWKQVDWKLYESSLALLGMALVTKPFGVFEEDKLTQAAPPGMAYVGNDKYGEWKKDNSGNRFWSWYGRYAFFSTLFFFPPSYYGYNSWNRWNNNYRYKKPYFGQTKKGGARYGTHGSFVKKSPGFQSSSFAKSGGLKNQAASVRGAGSKLRGGGPKSMGK